MNYNYHTHTTRCRHAKGTPEEYIQRAIENGIRYMGFSDHAPFICSDGFEAGYRVPMAEVTDYFAELNELRQKYADKIDIKIGFEMEYYPEQFAQMLQTVVDFGAEYLILGQHFLQEEHPIGTHTIKPSDDIDRLQRYVSCVVSAIESGAFSYVAHPDILNFTGDPEVYRTNFRKICVASRACNVPLEINFLGIRENRTYPTEAFWQIVGAEKAPVTFGFDTHDVLSAYDGDSLKKALQMVEKYELNYIGMPRLENPKHANIYK